MAISANTSFKQSVAIDPKGLDQLRLLAGKDQKAAARGIAQQFEAMLLQQMLGAMRAASPVQEETQTGAFGLFRGMQDQQFAQVAASRGGLGFADAILRQIEVQQNPALLKKPLPKTEKSVAVPAVATAGAPVAAAKPAAVSASTAGFLDKISGVATRAAQALGLAPQTVLAHAALESGWGGKSIKMADGRESHNVFGIKAGRDWQGKTADVTTTEYVDGVAQKRVEKFRAYDSYADAFADYAKVIKTRFAGAAGADSAAAYGQALQSGGYATDPQYGQKFARVAQSVSERLAAGQARSRMAG